MPWDARVRAHAFACGSGGTGGARVKKAGYGHGYGIPQRVPRARTIWISLSGYTTPWISKKSRSPLCVM
jgi:hypothetical protein